MPVSPSYIEKAVSYAQYRTLIDNLILENKTTGETQSADLFAYTRLNVHRMLRLEKQVRVGPAFVELLKKRRSKELWLVLAESWCGDVAQNLPAIQKIAAESPDIALKVLLRDENLELMDEFLTNGTRSIPKLISLDAETREVKWHWGPRPAPAQALMMSLKKDESLSQEEKAAKLHHWYSKDKTQTLQREIMQLMTG
ncbi:MAG: thioredoxin family protein [Balneolales bacterium]